MSNITMQELIKDDYKNWNIGDSAILNGATGSGKTYFILNVLAKYVQAQNEKILYLVSRNSLQNDLIKFVDNLGLDNTVLVTTYQSIQMKMIKGIPVPCTKYIIYDECHYFTCDGWNGYVDEMYKFLELKRNKSINIFISGTGTNIFNFLNNKGYVTDKRNIYNIPYNYSYVDKVVFYNDDETVEDIFDNVQINEKVIYFSKTLDRAVKLYKKYKDKANFICSKYCTYSKYNEDCIRTYSKNLITFNKQILITTTAFDVGVTLKDRTIKYIITDLTNIDQLQQCLGRKRVIDDNDTCVFYIKNQCTKSLNGSISTIKNKILNDASAYYNDRENFIKNHNRNVKNNPCFYYSKSEIDTTKEDNSKIGNLMFNYYTYIHYVIEVGNLQTARKIGFDKFVLNKLGDSIKKVTYIKSKADKRNQDKLMCYLEGVVGKVMLISKDREELIEKINLRDNRNNRLLKRKETLNSYFQEIGFNFFIKEFETSRIINGKKKKYKHAWKVFRLTDK